MYMTNKVINHFFRLNNLHYFGSKVELSGLFYYLKKKECFYISRKFDTKPLWNISLC